MNLGTKLPLKGIKLTGSSRGVSLLEDPPMNACPLWPCTAEATLWSASTWGATLALPESTLMTVRVTPSYP